MTVIFLICVAIGVPIVLFQFVMTAIGLGAEAFDVDVPQDLGHDFGGDFHGDLGGAGDFHGDVGAGGGTEFHGDAVVHDVHHGDTAHHAGHGSTSFFRILSFRTVVAAVAFFGIGGLGAMAAGLGDLQASAVALVSGGAAMYGVYWLMRGLYMLHAEGTVRIQRAVGQRATVYLRVPPHRSGAGKVQINLQNRTMEYLAVTPGEAIPTGSVVVVTDVVNPETVEVAAVTGANGAPVSSPGA